MLKGENSDTETKDPEYAGIQIQLTDVALINMSKSFYYLRRVSNNGLNDNATICGTEVSNNYVVDTDAAFKKHIILTTVMIKRHTSIIIWKTE